MAGTAFSRSQYFHYGPSKGIFGKIINNKKSSIKKKKKLNE